MKKLDLNKADDARYFLNEVISESLPFGHTNFGKITELTLADGSVVQIKDLSDNQAIQYAWELLPMYQKKFPHLVDVQNEH